MSVPSDISRSVENLMIYFFYAVGSVSLLVNTATLMIIVRKSSALTPEIKTIAIFQQVRIWLYAEISFGSSFPVYCQTHLSPYSSFRFSILEWAVDIVLAYSARAYHTNIYWFVGKNAKVTHT